MCTCVGLAVLATAVDGLASFRLTLCSSDWLQPALVALFCMGQLAQSV